MNGLSNSTRLAGDDGTAPRLQGSRLVPHETTGDGFPWNQTSSHAPYDWPGKRYGIRRPEEWETPLNLSEITLAALNGLKL